MNLPRRLTSTVKQHTHTTNIQICDSVGYSQQQLYNTNQLTYFIVHLHYIYKMFYFVNHAAGARRTLVVNRQVFENGFRRGNRNVRQNKTFCKYNLDEQKINE